MEAMTKRLMVPCRTCKGEGVIHGPVRAVGISWATPHGIPDWADSPCEMCYGTGVVEYGQYYVTLEEALENEGVGASGVLGR